MTSTFHVIIQDIIIIVESVDFYVGDIHLKEI